MTESSNKGFWGYKAVVGAFLVMFVNLGVCSTLGVFLASLAEYSQWDLGTVGYIGTVNTIGNIVLSIVAVKSLEKLGVKKTMLISIIACACHMCFYCMVTPGKTTASLIFMYIAGFLASFSITFGTHAACSTVIAKWFIEKREHLTGIVFSGAGFGAAIWVFIAGQLFRVTDYKGCYRVIIILTLIIGLIAIIFLVKDPEKMGQKPLGWEKAEEASSDTENVELPGIEKSAAMKTPSFRLLCGALLCVCSAGSTFMAYSPAWWQANGWSATAASNWDALYLLLSGFVLLFVGKILSKVKVSVFVVCVCVAYAVAAVVSSMMNGSPVAMLMILIVLFGALAYPLSASIPGLMGQSIFGAKDAGAISATLMTAVYLGQALYNPIVARFLASDGGFPAAWRFFAGAVILGMILILLATAMSPVNKKN